MDTAQAQLTPAADTTPAVVEIPAAELSGGVWCTRFPASTSIADCVEPFKQSLSLFVAALGAAGAEVSIANTYRPPQRAFLMHWSWRIVNEGADPRTVPGMTGVAINWAHTDVGGGYSPTKSVAAAQEMVNTYGLPNLKVPPALNSRHTLGLAVDMSISWVGDLSIVDGADAITKISTTPKTGMNAELKVVGATYGVVKFVGGSVDRPHWSDNGH